MYTRGLCDQPIVVFELLWKYSISITLAIFIIIIGVPRGFDLHQVRFSYNIIMNGTVYSGPLQSDADILNQLSSHTVHVLS